MPREIRGLPAGTSYLEVRPATATVGLLDFRTAGGEQRVGLIDLATATVSDTYRRVQAVSASRVVRTEEASSTSGRDVVVRERATGKYTVVPVAGTGPLAVELLGDWLLFDGQARHLVTGETVTLFDRVNELVTVADGTAVVAQGARGRNTGIHRVALGTDGKPVVSFVARSTTPGGLAHDIDADGYPDLLGRDSAGTLWRDNAADGRPRVPAGTGWQTYDKIAGGSDGTYTARKLIGGGWQVYGQITGAGDVDHDGRADLLAHDQVTKRVYLHAWTGDWRRPFAKRTLTDVHPGATYNHIA